MTFPMHGEIKFMFQTTNQSMIFVGFVSLKLPFEVSFPSPNGGKIHFIFPIGAAGTTNSWTRPNTHVA